MRIFLGSDHAGFELKQHLVDRLKELGHEPVDVGPHVYVASDERLTRINEQYYLSPSAPEFILFTLSPIDRRFPTLRNDPQPAGCCINLVISWPFGTARPESNCGHCHRFWQVQAARPAETG